MLTDTRLRQLSRMYSRPLETIEDARLAIAAEPGVLASELFLEAAASDDVTSIEGAQEYLEARLRELAELVGASASAVRAEFGEKVAAWG
ncbi:MAG TPA: hypothetical protein PJ994_00890 [Tepidiformaceae bacterium]|nr:hypothetical protein [Tepidiformaceae bacterium]HMO97448.1 hypothetical protein [Tepidiformaceae bacterium]